jgi:hypothetical protein
VQRLRLDNALTTFPPRSLASALSASPSPVRQACQRLHSCDMALLHVLPRRRHPLCEGASAPVHNASLTGPIDQDCSRCATARLGQPTDRSGSGEISHQLPFLRPIHEALNCCGDCGIVTARRVPRAGRGSPAEIAAINRKCDFGLGPPTLRRKTFQFRPEGGPVIAGSSTPALTDANALPAKVAVHVNFDTALLAKVDAAARRQGISRTAWLHRASFDALDERGRTD